VTDVNTWIDDRSRAIYTQETYDLSDFVEGLKVTAGLSLYARSPRPEHRSGRHRKVATPARPARSPPIRRTRRNASNPFNKDHANTSYTAGLEYQVAPDVLLYFTHRRGYRAGGINALAGPVLLAVPPIPTEPAFFVYGPETIIDNEIGIKADWHIGDMSLRTKHRPYHDTVHKVQINQTFGVGSSNVSALTNAGQADVDGADLDLTFIPVKPLEIRASYAFTSASYGPFVDYLNRNPVTNAPTTVDGQAIPVSRRLKQGEPQRAVSRSCSRSVGRSVRNHQLDAQIACAARPDPDLYTAGVTFSDPAAYSATSTFTDLTVTWTMSAGPVSTSRCS